MTSFEPERDSKLVVDSNAVPAALVAPQRLEAISRWHPQIVQGRRSVDRIQFSSHQWPQLLRQLARTPEVLSVEDLLRGPVGKGPDHGMSLHGYRVDVKDLASEQELSKALGRKVDLNTPNSLSKYFRARALTEAVPLHFAA